MNPIIFIQTPRLIIRSWKPSDYAPYVAQNADTVVMEYYPSVLTEEETLAQLKRIEKHFDEYGYGLFAVERKDNHSFIGYVGLSHPGFESAFTPCVEIGWRLSRVNWGQGFATEAAQAVLEYGFQKLGLSEIYSWTSIHNKRSEQVMKKIGMLHDGYFDHPLIADGDFLKPHVRYKLNNPA